MADSGRPIISLETIGSSVTASILEKAGFLATSLKALLISSTVAFLLMRKVKSDSEPTGVGTLIATPSKSPFKAGMVSVVAIAAPVVVGTMFSAAALALRRSL